MNRKVSAVLFALVCFFTVLSQARANHKLGSIHVSPVLGHWMAYEAPNMLDDGPLWGARFGLDLCPYFGLEGFAMQGPSEVSPSDGPGMFKLGATCNIYGIGARLNLHSGSFVPFLSVATGKAKAKFDSSIRDINGASVSVGKEEDRDVVLFGGGFEYFFHKNVGIRFDVVDHYLDRDFIDMDWQGDNKTHNLEFGVGLSLLAGGKGKKKAPDTDSDGVPDALDQCPGTPPGVKVYSNGCPVDTDQDGVPDYLDRCPGTAAGTAVDDSGCPLPEKKVKEVAKEPVDSDRDGVPDDRDAEPNTPAGAKVDSRGKARDSDNDGVPDGIDRCADTPAGLPVDATGCPLYTPEQFALSVFFDIAKSAVPSRFFAELDRIAALIKKTGARVRVTGYTDQVGPEDYNRRLSDRRARAVRDYLITAGVPANRLEVTASGKYPVQPGEKLDRSRQRCVTLELIR